MPSSVPPIDLGITLAPGKSIHIDEKLSKNIVEQQSGLRSIRGNIIAASAEIELRIDIFLKQFFFPPKDKQNEQKSEIFDSYLLKTGRFTFDQKVKLLEKIVCTDSNNKKLIKKLGRIREVRNQFAHRPMAFEPSTDPKDPQKNIIVPYLHWVNSKIKLDDAYFSELNKTFQEASNDLELLIKNQNTN